MILNLQVSRFDKIFFKFVNKFMMDLPVPKNMKYFWNFGFYTGVFLGIQFMSGLLLSMSYLKHIDWAFFSVDQLVRDYKYGWLLRFVHSKGASMYFFFMYVHVGRGLYYFSFNKVVVWLLGCVILMLSMAVGFFGYVLPWGKMSYWAATVITNLFSVIPYMGLDVVQWLWGGFSLDLPSLSRFFIFHFLLPFLLVVMFLAHVVSLHEKGSNNPLGFSSGSDKIRFLSYSSDKDVWGLLIVLIIFIMNVFFFSFFVMKSDNFLEANYLMTPSHMEPEWYLITAYVVLRSVPKKLGGVVLLLLFFLVYFLLPFVVNSLYRGLQYNFYLQFVFFYWMVNYFLLTWLGFLMAQYPFMELGRFFSFVYFFYFFLLYYMSKWKY